MRFRNFNSFPKRHEVITPSNSTDLRVPMIIYINDETGGTIAVHDMYGASVTYVVERGEYLPLVVRRVLETGTDITGIVGLSDV